MANTSTKVLRLVFETENGKTHTMEFLNLIIRFITGARLSRRWKSLIAILVSTLIGFASTELSGQFDTGTILKSIAFAFSISQIFYDQVFKDLFDKKI